MVSEYNILINMKIFWFKISILLNFSVFERNKFIVNVKINDIYVIRILGSHCKKINYKYFELFI